MYFINKTHVTRPQWFVATYVRTLSQISQFNLLVSNKLMITNNMSVVLTAVDYVHWGMHYRMNKLAIPVRRNSYIKLLSLCLFTLHEK